MRRVLMVCPYFVPSASVAAKRPLRFVRHLPREGWEPIVLTVEGSAGSGTDARQEALLPEGLKLERSYAGPSWGLWRRFEAYKASMRGKGDQAKAADPKQVKRMEALIDLTFTLTPFDRFVPYAYHASREITRLCREQQIDAVYVTATPFSALLAGVWAKQKTQLPLLLDLRDPWVLDPLYFHKKPALLQRLERRAERRCFTQADRILLNTERAADAYRLMYPEMSEKLSHLHNGFDQEQFLPVPEDTAIESTIVHFGSFYEHRTMGNLLRAVQRFPRLKLVVYGSFRDEDRALAASLGMSERLEQRKTVTYERSLQELSKAGVLLLIQSEDTDVQIPAKLFDYLCAKRPILALANNPEISKILQDAGAGVATASHEEEALALALEELLTAPPLTGAPLASFDAATQASALAGHLNAITR